MGGIERGQNTVLRYPTGVSVVEKEELDFKGEKLARGHWHGHKGNSRTHYRLKNHHAQFLADKVKNLLEIDN